MPVPRPYSAHEHPPTNAPSAQPPPSGAQRVPFVFPPGAIAKQITEVNERLQAQHMKKS
jgi:hypothetical protein